MINAHGLFVCRQKGFHATFKFDGVRRMQHEKAHGLHKANATSHKEKLQDGVFNYQCALLDIGMVIINFFDAISEGDGQRVIRCWKFMLLFLRNDGARSRKYALEALNLLCQVNFVTKRCTPSDLEPFS